ncbi:MULTISPECIES: hypothetical protein [unclassified Streptomyces]|uniref:hypothetical protein n=1 Tax=unclassified Streptomyces TaxID=2593676 RepID=UPI0011B9451E|nr:MULTISPECIES: hypothetical protein [unclassified Streptomyces]
MNISAARRALECADASARSAFVRRALGHLLNNPEVDRAAAADLDISARSALRDLRVEAASAVPDPGSVGRLLSVIDAGTLADGDMGAELLHALLAAEAWHAYLLDGAVRQLVDLAQICCDAADFQQSPLDAEWTSLELGEGSTGGSR